jgi:hypothetical protein
VEAWAIHGIFLLGSRNASVVFLMWMMMMMMTTTTSLHSLFFVALVLLWLFFVWQMEMPMRVFVAE